MKSLGVILIVLGIAALIYTGFTFTTKETIAEVGPLELKADREHTVSWPPLIGMVLVVGGVVLILADRRTR